MGMGVGASGRVGWSRVFWPIVAGVLMVTPLAATWGSSVASAASGPTVSIGDASIVEGDVHSRNLVFAVTLSEASASTVMVDYVITGNDAVGGNAKTPNVDFNNKAGKTKTLTFKKPATAKPTPVVKYVSVPVYPDTTAEGDETLEVTLSNATAGYAIGDDVGTGTIIDDDPVSETLASVGDASIHEGDTTKRNAKLRVTLSQPAPSLMSVDYTIVPVTATGGYKGGNNPPSGTDIADRLGASKTVTFKPGNFQKIVSVTVYPDTTAEADEAFQVVLANPTGGLAISRGTGTGTIADDDAASTSRVSQTMGGVGGNGASGSTFVSTSADGRYVAFESAATNLVPGDTNFSSDVFVKDVLTGAIALASVDASGSIGNAASMSPVITPDGRYVVFQSFASNILSGNTSTAGKILRKDLVTGAVALASVDQAGATTDPRGETPDISDDGRFVSFTSPSSDLVPGDSNGTYDVFVKDMQSGSLALVSTNSGGSQLAWAASARMTPDARFLTFFALPGGAYRKDRVTGALDTVSTAANFANSGTDVSADGRYVSFASSAALVPEKTSGIQDIFVKDMTTGTITRVSAPLSGIDADAESFIALMSADGRYVAFSSAATNLIVGDVNGVSDVFVKDRGTGIVTRSSVTYQLTEANGASGVFRGTAISPDGKFVAFGSDATNLNPEGDTNGSSDVFWTHGPAWTP